MKIVTTFDYERAKHTALFDKIKDSKNWKNPIDCWIPQGSFESFNQAVVFFTGGSLYQVPGEENGDLIHCKANGYYVDCGA